MIIHMKTYPYNCKFCGRPGTVQAADEGLYMFTLEKWIPNICCDRCGKYMERKRKIMESLKTVCRNLEVCRLKKQEVRAKVEPDYLVTLIAITKSLATIVNEHYRVTNTWEEEFAKEIFNNPTKFSTIVNVYINSVAGERRRIKALESRATTNDP